MDGLSRLRDDAKAIYIGNLNTVDADLPLPVRGKNGSVISWKSSRPYLVGDTGKVTRPHAGAGDREVTLTACLSLAGETLEQDFALTVLAKEFDWTAARLLPTECRVHTGEKPRIPAAVIAEKTGGGFVSLPARWNLLPGMPAPGRIRITGAPPLEKQPELIPEAIIHVGEERQPSPERRLSPFPLNRARVEGGMFYENKRRMLEYLKSVDDGSMLYNFRAAAGLDTKGAAPPTGWDDPECLLKGHTTGHYLSALALAACCGENETVYRAKIRTMVSGLAECQRTMAESGRFREGYLSGYPEDQFDLLEQFVPYPKIWAPYYTLHKIIAGLLDCYELAGEAEALSIVEKLGLWVYNRLSACGEEKRRKMWSMYIAGEYGGMNEVMARLYRFSSKPEYLQAAHFFDNDLLFYPMERNMDTLPGIHANQHIPQMVGALALYEGTAERRYYDAALHFWQIAAGHHAYSIGGVGEGEMFREAGRIAGLLTDKTAECCASYNMLKLTARLFDYTTDPVMADYYERTLYNHIAAGSDRDGPTGGNAYFMPLGPGTKRTYDTDGNSCCHGTGLESPLRVQEFIYRQAGDALYVNLFIPSALDWTEKVVRIIQRDGYLEQQAAEITVEGGARFGLRLRIPGWLGEAPKLLLNEVETAYSVQNGYGVLERAFSDGDRIRWQTPFAFRFEPSPDDHTVGSILYGPLVMAVESDTSELLSIGGLEPKAALEPLTFTCGGFTLRPFCQMDGRPCHAYVKKAP